MLDLSAMLFQALLLVLLPLLIYTTWRIFYNIFLHPLRSFPGPLLSRATLLRRQTILYGGLSHLHIHKLHEKYGPIVRLAPNELSFIEPTVWKEIHGHQATGFSKDLEFYGSDIYGHPPGIIRADNVGHARQRKLVSHAFSDKALREQESILKGYTELLITKLRELAQGSEDTRVDIVDWYNFTSFDIMADLAFGESLNLLKGSVYDPWVRSMFDHGRMILVAQNIRQWPWIDYVLQFFIPAKIKERRKTHVRFTCDRVEKRLARKTDRPDLTTYILRHSNNEGNKDKGLAPSELNSNMSTFMLAGTETTATELSGLTYYLLTNPAKMQRLVKEIRDAFPRYEDLTMGSLAELKYLQACIEEGLRIYPPVPQGLPRITPQGGAQISGAWIPEKTLVGFSQYAAYHSTTNFEKPEAFLPERWLPEAQAEYARDRKEAVNAFSYGPRNCLGKNLAYHEMRLILASILWNFDLELCEESNDWINHRTYIFWQKGALMVKLTSVR